MEKKTWQEIVNQYPDCYVALVDIVFDGAEVSTATVVMSCSDDEIGSNDTKLRQKGISASWFRTTDLGGANTLCQNN